MGPRRSQFKLSTHRKLQKRQLEGKLNLQGRIMSYTCPGIILPCGPTYHIYSFVLDCHVGPTFGKEKSYKRDEAVEEKGRTSYSEKEYSGKEPMLLLVSEIFCNPLFLLKSSA